jgi:RNA polymerase primary sigma factor
MKAQGTKSWDDNAIYYQYIKDINRYPLLQPLEEKVLLRKASTGNKKAIDKLVLSNLKFVINIAFMYKNQGLSTTELINEGNLGLIEAAKRFDPERPIKFISYAVWWIRQSITRAISEKARLVRISAEKELVLRRFNRQSRKVRQTVGGQMVVDSEDLSKNNDNEYNEGQIEKILSMGQRHSSLDTPVGEDGSTTIMDVTEGTLEPTDTAAILNSETKYIGHLLEGLNQQEQKVLSMYFGINNSYSLNLQEIGKIIGLSKERVRQVKEKGLSKLREFLSSRKKTAVSI